MNNAVKVSELPAKWRAKAKRIRGMTAGSDLVAYIMEVSAEDLEAALARKESAPISVDRLAQIIRRLDSRQLTGAHEMAEAILAEVSIPAPPAAQAVDLEQFRECVIEAKEVWLQNAENWKGRSRESRYREWVDDCDRLLALIDQQAGGAK